MNATIIEPAIDLDQLPDLNAEIPCDCALIPGTHQPARWRITRLWCGCQSNVCQACKDEADATVEPEPVIYSCSECGVWSWPVLRFSDLYRGVLL